MLKNKKLIIVALVLVIIIVLALIFLPKLLKQDMPDFVVNPEIQYQPEFMSPQELTSLGFPTDSKIQVFQRNENNEVEVYRIIRQEEYIIYDLEEFRRNY